MATLQNAVEKMRNPDGTYTASRFASPAAPPWLNSVQVPIWDTPGVDVTSTFTTTMTEDEVYPPIQEEPIRVAAHSIFVRGAFDYSTFARGGGKQEVRYTKFIPK